MAIAKGGHNRLDAGQEGIGAARDPNALVELVRQCVDAFRERTPRTHRSFSAEEKAQRRGLLPGSV